MVRRTGGGIVSGQAKLAELIRGSQHERMLKAGRDIAQQIREGDTTPWSPVTLEFPSAGAVESKPRTKELGEWRKQITRARATNRARLQCLLQSVWYLTQHEDESAMYLWGHLASVWELPPDMQMPTGLVDCKQLATRLTALPRQIAEALALVERGEDPTPPPPKFPPPQPTHRGRTSFTPRVVR